ncbi:MAG: hypothetical protein AAF840_13465, partial [Bacteroidota bacterium]
AQQQFAKAAEQYKLYLRTLRADHPSRQMLIEDIRRCENGLRMRYGEGEAIVENLGQGINTTGDEFGPIPSPNQSSRFYFTARRPGNAGGLRNAQQQPDEKFGQARTDMFSAQSRGGQWPSADPMHYLLNSPQEEQLIGFSAEGQVLLYFQGWSMDRGVIFADTFQQASQRTLTTTPFLGPLDGQAGEQNFYLYNDTLLIFASRRPGGYGGLDLWQSSFRAGRWTPPTNLGDRINTSFDETTPFLARNGRVLYFSTNASVLSAGGLDIVRSTYIPEAAYWSPPDNLGFPINSAADDAHFRLSKDGFTGFLSSSRKDGIGGQDIYVAYFTKYRQEMERPSVNTSSPPPARQPVAVQIPTPTPVPVPMGRPAENPPVSTAPPSPMVAPPSNAERWISGSSDFRFLPKFPQWISEFGRAGLNYPTSHLVLTGYLPQAKANQTGEDLYQLLQKLQTYGQLLERQGIATNRIFYRVLVHPTRNYQIHASLAPNLDASGIEWPIIGTDARRDLSAADEPLCYKVQIVSVQRPHHDPRFDGVEVLMLENPGGQPYGRFTAGAFTDYASADQYKQQLVRQGFNGAFVVPYVYGERLERDRVRFFTNTFPDLNRYLGR